MKHWRGITFLCLGVSAVIALVAWFRLVDTRAEAQGPKALTARVTAVLDVPGRGKLTRFEDPE
jgi:predicted MFS family arabinose efflux permease